VIFSFWCTHPTQGEILIKTYNVEEIERANIKFKSFSWISGKIEFDKYSHMLYLPRMT
jgi:hypothetical protein